MNLLNLTDILRLIFAISVVIFVITFQFRVCKKYWFDYVFTKVDENNKTITIKKQIISFSDIKSVRVKYQNLNFAERYLVSIAFFAGVMEMILYLQNGSQIFVYQPKNYILNFCKQLENNGVNIEYYDI